MQGLVLHATFEAIKEEVTVLLKEIDARTRASANDYGMPSAQGIWPDCFTWFQFQILAPEKNNRHCEVPCKHLS